MGRLVPAVTGAEVVVEVRTVTLGASVAYKLKLEQSLDKSLHGITSRQIGKARRMLATSKDPDKGVHEARKTLKRLRALLRLLRAGLSPETYDQTMTALRDLGRTLAGKRDAYVVLRTIDKLRTDADPALAAALEKLKRKLDGRTDKGKPDGQADDAGQPLAELRAVEDRLEATAADGDWLDVIEAGLIDAHRKGRAALRAAQEQPSDDTYHELRKAVQIHWRHMQLLQPAWPELLGLRVQTARKLSGSIGEDHDLAMLALAALKPKLGLSRADVQLIVTECRDAQAKLRHQSTVSAARMFALKPRRFAREIIAYLRLADTPANQPEAAEPFPDQPDGPAAPPAPDASSRLPRAPSATRPIARAQANARRTAKRLQHEGAPAHSGAAAFTKPRSKKIRKPANHNGPAVRGDGG